MAGQQNPGQQGQPQQQGQQSQQQADQQLCQALENHPKLKAVTPAGFNWSGIIPQIIALIEAILSQSTTP